MAPARATVKTVEPSIRELLSSHSATLASGGLVYAHVARLWPRRAKSVGWIARQRASGLRSRSLNTWSRPLSIRVTAPRSARQLATVISGKDTSL